MEMYLVLREKGGNIISVIHATLGHAADKQRTRVMAGNADNEQTTTPEGTLGYVTCALAATAQSAERKWARQWPIRP